MTSNLKKNIRCVVATKPEHIRDAMILRSICFVHEHGHSPDFIFDGNDQQATHFVFYDGEEPIGSLRVRWFADFAKYERTCFRVDYRHPVIIKKCVLKTFEHVARKGYTKVLTQAEERLAQLWLRLFEGDYVDDKKLIMPGGTEIYRTVAGPIPAADDPITMTSDAAILLKVEGEWDKPGAFEHHE